MIRGSTTLIAHLGYPTEAFKAPMIYNPWFEQAGIDAVVMPMGVRPEDYAQVLAGLFKLTNIRGALITMPHKVSTLALLDAYTPAVEIAGACNAVLRRADGSLLGDMFDGAGFVRGVLRKGLPLAGARVLVVGSGGVGSAIAASLAAAGVAAIGLYDVYPASAEALGARLRKHYPALQVAIGGKDPAGYGLAPTAKPSPEVANPLGLDGIEFIEYTTAKPQALGQVLEMMGFRPVARHRSREVMLYRQGGMNVIVNATSRPCLTAPRRPTNP
jgi:shikimate dehydrogenase